jgi:Xaa-Pro aminopeptidase
MTVDVVSGLPSLQIAGRAERVRRHLDGVDALLVTDPVNVRWLTGFTGSSGWLLVLADHLALVTDGRYGEQATAQLAAAGVDSVVLEGRSVAAMTDLLTEATSSIARLGFESSHVTFAEHQRLAAALTAEMTPTTGIVQRERRSKDQGEIARMAAACRIADQALADVWPLLHERPTEIVVRNALETRMRELGADGPSYETIVATGPTNAPLPHHRPEHTVIEDGHTVIIDVGALVDGYHSDMTRTFVVGEPTALQREVYDVVLAAQEAGCAAVRPGLVASELDAVCREAITSAGFGPWFSHGTGHGVGLLIHEDPFVNSSSTAVLQVGDVVTVEPGVYRGDLGGVRVEDLVVVTAEGCRILTNSSKDTPCPQSPPTT